MGWKNWSGATYIKGLPDEVKSHGSNLGKENLDRVMNNARWLIYEISSRMVGN